MTRYVVDANVAIKWVIPEVHDVAAQSLLQNQHELFVPDFFFPEIGNIFWKRVRRGDALLEEVKEDLENLLRLPLHVCDSQWLLPQALDIAVRIQQAVYDCVYLTLAISQQCQMVTADERFYNALQGDVLKRHLLWVEELL